MSIVLAWPNLASFLFQIFSKKLIIQFSWTLLYMDFLTNCWFLEKVENKNWPGLARPRVYSYENWPIHRQEYEIICCPNLPQLDFEKFEICPREILLSDFWEKNKILVKLPNFELKYQQEYARYEKNQYPFQKLSATIF